MHAKGTATATVCVCEWWRKYEKAIYYSVHPRSTLVVAARGRTHDTRAQTLSLNITPIEVCAPRLQLQCFFHGP